MNKSESKYFNTACLMDEALIALLERKDLEYITVKEICEKAGVHRSTFYLHYGSVADLMEEVTQYINTQFFSYFSFNSNNFKEEIEKKDLKDLVMITPQFLRPYLTFVKEHRQIFRAAFKNPKGMQANMRFDDLKKYVLEPILKRFAIPAEDHRYWIDFFIHGTMAIIRDWVMENCVDSVEKIESVIIQCVRPQYGQDLTSSENER